jgi:hypothetical protein
MNKIILTTLFSVFTASLGFSQDIITKKSSEDIQAKVTEVTTTEIKYKKFDNQSGPTFTILKSDVLMIRYENGSKDIFTDSPNTSLANNSSSDMQLKGKQDANANYKGKKSGAGWTAATTIVLSPLFGLIPAVACASSEPSDENLKYKDAELMKNNTYNQSYAEQAHKIKKKKVWTNFGIGSGAWLLLILLF